MIEGKVDNLIDNKVEFFSLHYGQKIMRTEQTALLLCDPLAVGNGDWFLELTPLSSISDEDAIEIAKILNPELYPDPKFKISKGYSKRGHNISENVLCIEVKNLIPFPIERYYLWSLIQIDLEENEIITGSFENDGDLLVDDHSENILHVYDYLRSRGYALPWFGLLVEELVNRGWVKLKEAIKCSD